MKSGGINEDELGLLLRRDGEFGFIDGGDAVANRNPLPVDEDHTLGWERDKQCRKRADGAWVRVVPARSVAPKTRASARIIRVSAFLGSPLASSISRPARSALGNLRLSQRGVAATLTRKQPDLEELEGGFIAIAFGVTDSGSGTHDLNVTSYGPTDVAGVIFMRDRALADIGDDFHVGWE